MARSTAPRTRCGVRAGVLLVGLLLILLLPAASAATFHRTYEASAAHATGAPGQGGGFWGFGICNPDVDSVFDTTACVRLPASAVGQPFDVQGVDQVFGTTTYFLAGIDLDGDGAIRCQGVGSEPCWFGQGGLAGTIPAGASGKTLRVFPVTVHATGLFCCPDSFATRGTIAITLA